LVEKSATPAWSREAVARLASLQVEVGRPQQALRYYQRLAGDLAGEVCLNGQTGKQLVEKLAEDSPLRGQLANKSPWPLGAVEVKQQPGGSSQNRNALFEISGNEPLPDLRLEWIHQTATLQATDGLGRQLWTLPLREGAQRNLFNYSYFPNAPPACVHGNFIAAAINNHVYAVDALGDGKGNPKLLWKQNLSETIPGLSSNAESQENQIMMRGVFFPGSFGSSLPVLGPVTGRQVVLQRLRSLIALDVLTGQTLWIRQNIPSQCTLFGDDEFVFCVPPDSNNQRALVFRTADGQPLGERAIPAGDGFGSSQGRLTTLGRNVLLSSLEGEKQLVRLFDPWKQTNVWQAKPLSPAARCCAWQQEIVAIMEPEGRVQILNMADGRPLVDEKVTPVTAVLSDKSTRVSLAEIFLLGSRDHFVLVANSVSQHDIAVNAVHPVPFGGNSHPMNPRVHGRLYGFDRATGKQLWSVEATRQGILLEQPSELPIVFLASSTYEQNPQVQGRVPPTLNLLILDKRTGRAIHSKQSSVGTLSYVDLVGDPEKKIIDL
jgi:outer membrane protein assembly factor BamB